MQKKINLLRNNEMVASSYANWEDVDPISQENISEIPRWQCFDLKEGDTESRLCTYDALAWGEYFFYSSQHPLTREQLPARSLRKCYAVITRIETDRAGTAPGIAANRILAKRDYAEHHAYLTDYTDKPGVKLASLFAAAFHTREGHRLVGERVNSLVPDEIDEDDMEAVLAAVAEDVVDGVDGDAGDGDGEGLAQLEELFSDPGEAAEFVAEIAGILRGASSATPSNPSA